MNSKLVFSFVLFILIIVISMIRIENFTLSKIIIEDEQSNEDYRVCLNENSQLYYKSNGMYPNCASALNKLSNLGFSPKRLNIMYCQRIETISARTRITEIKSIYKISDDSPTDCFNEPLNFSLNSVDVTCDI